MKPIKTKVEPKISLMKNIKAVLFDIYGTMVISAAGDILATEIHAKSVVFAFESVGISIREDLDIIETGGIIINKYMENIFETHDKSKSEGVIHPEVDVVAIWKSVIKELLCQGLIIVPDNLDYKVLSMAFELKTNPVWPMPGLKEILNVIKEKNIYLGIVSNSQFFTPMIVNYFICDGKIIDGDKIIGFEEDLCVYSYKEKIAKPSIELFEKAVPVLDEKYNIKPEEVLYVGNDMLNDVYCADKVGFKTVLFAGDVRSLRIRSDNKLVSGIEPDVIITELMQLEEVL